MNMAFSSGNGALVFVFGGTALKYFYGPGACKMIARERAGLSRATQCPVWCSHVLPVHFGRFRISTATACQEIRGKDTSELETFVKERVQEALNAGSPLSATELLPFASLEKILNGSDQIVALVRDVLDSIDLPSGPTHGDLHRGNLMRLDNRIQVIDFDRFRNNGCPLFDLLHFYLSEAQRGTGKPWLDILYNRYDIVERAARQLVVPERLYIAYALQRIGHEGESAILQGRRLDKYTRQTNKALSNYYQKQQIKVKI